MAERAKLRAAASAAVAHSAERDRVAQERALLDAVAAQQAALIAKQARGAPSRRAALTRRRARCFRKALTAAEASDATPFRRALLAGG